MNPFKELYWKQFGGGPDEAAAEVYGPGDDQFPRRRAKEKRDGIVHREFRTAFSP